MKTTVELRQEFERECPRCAAKIFENDQLEDEFLRWLMNRDEAAARKYSEEQSRFSSRAERMAGSKITGSYVLP